MSLSVSAGGPAPGLFGMALVGVSLMVVGMGQALVFAIVPPAARHLGLSEMEVGAIFGVSAVFWMAMSPVWGHWSDRVGRRRVLILGLLGYATSLSGFASALQLGQSGVLVLGLWPMLMLGRIVNGVVGSATRPAALGYVADLTGPENRSSVLAKVESGFTLGTVLGPALGGLLLTYSLLAPFYMFAGMGLGMALLCLYHLKDPPVARSPGSRQWLSPLDVRLQPQLFIAATLGVCNATVLLCLAFYLEDMVGVTAADVGYYAALGLTLAAVSSVFAQWVLVPQYARHPDLLMRTGSLILLLAMLLLAMGESLYHAAGAMALYGLGFGMIRPGNVTLLSLSVRPGEQGAAAGMMGMVIPVGHILSPLIAMPLYGFHPQIPFWLCAVLMSLILGLLHLHPRFRRSPWRLRHLRENS